MMEEMLICANALTKSYRLGAVTVPVLKDVTYDFRRHRWTALVGASGSGKTTLLNILGALEAPDSGTLLYGGEDYARVAAGRRAGRFRSTKIGFVFQSYQLLTEFSIAENVMLPALLGGSARRAARPRAEQLLVAVGLADRLNHRPNELSGGEQQRAAIARALMLNPELILADEPTGNLDSRTGREILELLRKLENDPENPRTIIMITHNRELAGFADEVAVLADGVLLKA